MATPVFPPSQATNILVNTRPNPKIVYLPAASTIGAGKLLFVKDICGNAGNSSIFLSTTGLDTFENLFRPSTLYALMSTNFQAMLLASDGQLNWMILQNYNANAISRYNAYYSYPATPLVVLQASTYSGSGTWFDLSPNAANATVEFGTAAKNGAGNGIVLNGSTCWTFKNIQARNAWTASVWYKNTGAAGGSGACIFTQIHNGTPINICLSIGTCCGNIQGWNFYEGPWRNGTPITLTNASWTYYTATWNGTTMVTYVNGVSQGSTTPGGTANDGGLSYRIGRRWDLTGFEDYVVGEVGEVRVYSSAITPAQVLIDFNYTKATYGL